MPTILREKGFRFFFFSMDRKEPLHIHVEYQEKYGKFWLEPVVLARSWGFRSHEITKLYQMVEKNKKLFKETWHEYFGSKS